MRHDIGMRALTTIAAELAADRRPDGALLSAFLSEHDEAAFAELLRRHGPLVWSACCRALPNRADAEDAFQAAFLVLVRRARKLARSAEVGPWLHRVAVLTARNVSRKNARRAAKQRDLSACTEPAAPVPPAPPAEDLDSALLELPNRVREAVVLCHLQGFSRREAAERLGCAEGTLSAWLNRGLAKLRRKLLEPAVPALAVPAALVTSTAKAATATTLAPAVSCLVEGVLHMFWVKKATAAAYSAVALFAMGVGVGLGTHTEHGTATAQEKVDAPTKPVNVPKPQDEDPHVSRAKAKVAAAQAALDAARKNLQVAALNRQLARNADPRSVADAQAALTRSEAEVEEALVKVEDARAELRRLEAARDAAAPKPRTRNEIEALLAELEKVLDSSQSAKKQAEKALRAGEDRLQVMLRDPDAHKREIEDTLAALQRFKANYYDAVKRIENAERDLVALKAAQKQPEAKVNDAALQRIADLEKELASAEAAQKLYQQQLLIAQLHEGEMRKKHDEHSGEVRAATAANELARRTFGDNGHKVELLRDQLAKLRQNSNGYIEITVRGTAGKFEFVVFEVLPHNPARSGEIPRLGPVVTSDRDALAKLLKRARADATAPLDLRVIVEPQVTMGVGPQWVLGACASAGHETVTFTGYVFGGGFAQQLQPTEKGDVKGYTRYDAKPVKPAVLVKEIEEGMRRF
jgi:RNA polymerase sigma factor (sigma-70 family)